MALQVHCRYTPLRSGTSVQAVAKSSTVLGAVMCECGLLESESDTEKALNGDSDPRVTGWVALVLDILKGMSLRGPFTCIPAEIRAEAFASNLASVTSR